MLKRLKGFYFIISSIVITLLHLPFAFAKSAAGARVFLNPGDSTKKEAANTPVLPAPAPMAVKSVYDSLKLDLNGLSRQAYEYAKLGFDKLVEQGRVINNSIISIVDFSQPS